MNPNTLTSTFNPGDTAWMLISSVLVLLMVVPGVALFYTGLVRRKNALATAAMVMGSVGFVTLAWVVLGYSLAFTEGNSWIGGTGQAMLQNLSSVRTTGHPVAPTVPEPVFVLFQLAFAILTVSVIYGAVVERMRFSAAMVFGAMWVVLVYAPIAHWIWHPTGWLHAMGHMDYAGGTVVHLASGTAALVLAIMTGNRSGYGRESMAPHNLMLTVAGAGMMWVGWFGFNGGSAMGATSGATMAVLSTQVAAGAGMFVWLLYEWLARGHVTLLGLVSGLLAGLICITPGSGYVTMPEAMFMGGAGAAVCFIAVTAVKAKLGYDDSLDVFGLHAVAGGLGTVMTGLFQSVNKDIGGQVLIQIGGSLAVIVYAAFATAAIAWILRATIGLRVSTKAEAEGLDLRQHGESLAA